MITKFENKYGETCDQVTDGKTCKEIAEYADEDTGDLDTYCRHHAGLEAGRLVCKLLLLLTEIDPVTIFKGGKYERIMTAASARAELIDDKNKRTTEFDPCFEAIVEEIGEVATVLQDKNYNKTRLRDELYDVLVATMRYLESVK